MNFVDCKDSHIPKKTRVQIPTPVHLLVEAWHFLGEQTVFHSNRKQWHTLKPSQPPANNMSKVFRRYFERSMESLSLGGVKVACCFLWFFFTMMCGNGGQLDWIQRHLRNRSLSMSMKGFQMGLIEVGRPIPNMDDTIHGLDSQTEQEGKSKPSL